LQTRRTTGCVWARVPPIDFEDQGPTTKNWKELVFRSAIRLYTIDLDDMALEAAPRHTNQSVYNGLFAAQRDQFKQRIQRRRKRIERWSDEFDMGSYVKEEPDIQKMRENYSEEFFSKFSYAFTNYENGDWAKAVHELEQTRFFNMVEDGPSAALLSFIRMYNGEAPPDWQGYHVVEEL